MFKAFHHNLLIYVLIFFCYFLVGNKIYGQSYYGLGLLPGLKVSKPFSDKFTLKGEAFSRLSYVTGDFSGHSDRNLDYNLTDLSAFGYYHLNPKVKLEGAYLFRFLSGDNRSRFIQGVYWEKELKKWNLGQRVRTDVTVGNDVKPIYRIRYRLLGTFNSPILNPEKKWKLKLSTEILNNFQSKDYSIEMRWVALLHRPIQQKNNIEFGLDYRVANAFTTDFKQHSFWVIFNYDINLNR